MSELLESRKGTTIGNFVLTFVTILVGLIFLPTIVASVNDAALNVTGATASLLNLVPLFYVLIVLAVAAIPAIVAFKQAQ